MLLLISDEFRAELDLVIKGIEPENMKAFFEPIKTEALSEKVSVVEGVARVPIHGPLAEKPNRFFSLFGMKQTSYADLRETLASLEQDPRVKSVEFAMDTPGGNVDGLYETMRAFRAFSKPTTAIIKSAHSAGFGLIASMDKRVAASETSTVGSVGVVASFNVNDSTVTIRSSASPLKNPDPKTDEGRAQLQDYVDKMYGFFAAELAAGMPQLNGNYGQGKVFFAAEAARAGLIDSITVAGSGGEKAKMKTFDEARAAFSAEFTAYEEKITDEATKASSEKERARVVEHIKLAAESGAYDIAMKAIESGEEAAGAVILRHQKAISAEQESARRGEATKGVKLPESVSEEALSRDAQFLQAFGREIGKDLN
jgi:ClpP class serine protease